MGAGWLLENSPPLRSGWAVAGVGSVMLVVLNRSSSSFRAEYLSPATLAGPVVTFLVTGGRVAAGGGAVSVRGSETLLVLTHGLAVTVVLLLSVEDNSFVNKSTPSSRLESSGSSGGKEESGARKGLETVLIGGHEEETGDVRKGLKEVFLTGDVGFEMLE